MNNFLIDSVLTVLIIVVLNCNWFILTDFVAFVALHKS